MPAKIQALKALGAFTVSEVGLCGLKPPLSQSSAEATTDAHLIRSHLIQTQSAVQIIEAS